MKKDGYAVLLGPYLDKGVVRRYGYSGTNVRLRNTSDIMKDLRESGSKNGEAILYDATGTIVEWPDGANSMDEAITAALTGVMIQWHHDGGGIGSKFTTFPSYVAYKTNNGKTIFLAITNTPVLSMDKGDYYYAAVLSAWVMENDTATQLLGGWPRIYEWIKYNGGLKVD